VNCRPSRASAPHNRPFGRVTRSDLQTLEPPPVLFNSYEFLFGFLPVVLVGFYLTATVSRMGAATWLGLASLFFYAWWSWAALPLLCGSIFVNYAFGRLIVRAAGESRRRAVLTLSLGANLATLGFFKYSNFFLQTVNSVAGDAIGRVEPLNIVLPIGISFYTFTQIAFLVDCYQGKVKEPRLVHYLLFVSYFPHVIAGPVLHHAQMMPQFADAQTYRPSASRFAAGIALFSIGLAKKLLIADPNGFVANRMYDAPGAPDFFRAWNGTLSYAFQIYFDFSGYSDMALGLSLLFGIRLPINFDSPYRATSIIDFWRRWHMSLSNFLRDYLYVPLGGNRHGMRRRYINLMITMVLGGLWHGASWTFVVWGALHGFYLVVNHVWRRLRGAAHHTGPAQRAASWLLTFVAVCFAWVFFRAGSFGDATQILRGMVGLNGVGWGLKWSHPWAYIVVAFALALFPWNSNAIAGRIEHWRGGRWAVAGSSGLAIGALLMFSIMRIAGGGSPQFLYFQF